VTVSKVLATGGVVGLLLSLCAPLSAAAADQPVIQIVYALYGTANTAHPVNFMSRLQQTCGNYSTYCEAFCTNAFVGRGYNDIHLLPFHPTPICRVTYRCGGEATLTTDAERNDLIVLACRPRP
jgi:hypothetical protein